MREDGWSLGELGEDMGRFRQFIVEYVGNLNHPESADQEGRAERVLPEPPAPSLDRRKNTYARELIDWIEGQMESRGLPAAKKAEVVASLRKAFHQRPYPRPVEVGEDDVAGVGASEWKGVSRDAPS
jgi:hypothetical protein